MNNLHIKIKHSHLNLSIDTSLPLSQGIVGVFGKSGAGKSTLLRVLASLEEAATEKADLDKKTLKNVGSEIHWQDKRIDKLPAEQNPCLLQTQQAQLFPNLTVLENLEFVLKYSNWAKQTPFTIEQVIQWCGIEHLLTQPSISLSGGEQQRANLARSLLCGKPIIMLDEPFSALDWNARTQLLSLLVQLQQDYKLYFVIVSHSLKELALTSKNLVVIESGKVIKTGLSEQLIPRLTTSSNATNQSVFSKLELSNPEVLPEHNLTKWQLINNPIPGTGSSKQACYRQENAFVIYSKGLVSGAIIANKQVRKSIVIDANRISLSKQADDTSSMLNHLPAQITEIKTIQDSVLVTLNLNDQNLFAEISQLSLDKMALNAGDHIFVQFKAV